MELCGRVWIDDTGSVFCIQEVVAVFYASYNLLQRGLPVVPMIALRDHSFSGKKRLLAAFSGYDFGILFWEINVIEIIENNIFIVKSSFRIRYFYSL